MGTLLLALFCALITYAQEAPPAIDQDGVRNAASLMPAALSGGSIARGSIFVIFGPRLASGPGGGVILSITKGAESVRATPLRVSRERIEARMPADAPLGPVALTVSYGGQSSVPFSLTVVEASFGIYTRNAKGWGRARGLGAGRTVTLHGTGLGSSRLVEVLVGGIQALRILYSGPRRCCPGEDEIRFVIPKGAPEGCDVPVQVRVGRFFSNVATLAIGRQSGCDGPQGKRLGAILLARADAAMRIGAAELSFNADVGFASFRALDENIDFLPPPGTCAAYTPTVKLGDLVSPGLGLQRGRGLDAGARILIRGPRGAKQLEKGLRDTSIYWSALGGNPPSIKTKPAPTFLEPGEYEVSAAGGADVGAFTAKMLLPPPFEWSNRAETDSVDRRAGVNLVWKQTNPDDRALGDRALIIAANVDAASGAMGLAVCSAPRGSTRFTIPPPMLANIPATPRETTGVLPLSLLAVTAVRDLPTIHARGVEKVEMLFVSASARTVVCY